MFEKIKKIFGKLNTQSQSITSAAIIIGGLSVASRFLGIFRDRVLAGQFGAGDVLDAYYAAFRLPDLVYNLLILGAVSAGLIPVFTSLLAKHHEKDAWRLINSILNLLSVLLLIVCVILFVSAPWLVPLITPGFPPEKMELVIGLSRIMFLSPFFLGLSAIFSSVLQSYRKFLIYSLAPLLYNLGIIFGALFLVEPFGVYGLAWGVVIGALAHMIIQLLPIFSVGFKYRFDFNFRDKNVIAVAKMMVPRTVSLAVSQINFVVITIVASTLAVGSLAVFNLSNNLQSFPLGVFGVSLGVAALPVLSALAAKKKMKDFITTLSATFRQTLFFIVPISILLYVLRAQIVRVILGSGRFDWQDTRLTAACLAIFCLGLFAQGAYPLVIRGFYALHNTKTPFYIGLATMVINLAGLLFFRWVFSWENYFSFATVALLRLSDLSGAVDLRVLALPAAITVSSIFELLVLLIALRRKIGRLDGRKIFSSTWRIAFASLGGGLIAYFLLQLTDRYVPTEKVWGLFTQGFIAGIFGLAGYAAIGFIFHLEEMFIFISSLKRRLFKSAVVMAEDSIAEGDKS
jgi:putative peptidoglycan lipid II flippase